MSDNSAPDKKIGDADPSASATYALGRSPQALKTFKEYKMPNGEILRVTKAEFERAVALVKLLHEHETELKKTNSNGLK